MSDSVVKVLPTVRVVANGKRRDKSGQAFVKFTVIAAPEPSESPSAITLMNWPQEMTTRLRQGSSFPFGKGTIKLYARPILAEAVPSPPPAAGWAEVELKATFPGAYAKADQWSAIGKLWKSTLGIGPDPWVQLARSIAQSIKGDNQDIALQGNLTHSLKTDPDGAIRAGSLDPTTTATIQGVVPIRQSDLAIEEETERAIRVLSKQMSGPHAFLEELEPEVIANFEDRFDKVVEKTQVERIASKAVYDGVKGLIGNGDAPPARTLPSGQAPLVPNARDTAQNGHPESNARTERRATHLYGTWLQRRAGENYTAKKVENRVIPAGAPEPQTEADIAARENQRGVYFSILGDPTLARLFALNFDFEVPEAVLAKALKVAFPNAPIDKLHLALAAPTGTALATVATTAGLHDKGFWPISAFESFIASREGGKFEIISEPKFVEQSDGLWKVAELMDSVSGPKPSRYSLTCLDLRRSVDSKTQKLDLGETQLTGGFTILDRGRASQVATSMALSNLRDGQADQSSSIMVLYAEDLTVGRHVDVAAAGAGTPLKDLRWRSLMHRYVNFDFGADEKLAEEVLKQLVFTVPNKGVLEEISFQVVSRLMPTSTDAPTYEAVTEEAIFMWDGTPAAVLTDPLLEDGVLKSLLPFSRELDLPASEMATASRRPAPLRFGYPYVFRFRSMFLGGGTPGANDPDTRDNTGMDEVLPAGEASKAKPRRFLRHERISAPTLALPDHLVATKMKRMGLELLDQAIVRSWDDTASNLNATSDKDQFNGPYVEKSYRVVPDNTMRVVLPPEASFDLIVRHGKLDSVANPNTIRQGGLRDVAYTPYRQRATAPDPNVEPIITPSGFPVAVTTVRDTFDPEGAMYRKRVDMPGIDADSAIKFEPTERGVPIFAAGGVNITQPGENGFLPDPAIDIYSIRARIRGSGRYLEGDLSVKLYEGTEYPNVLPLIMVISKADKYSIDRRLTHPTKITDIASHVGPSWLRSNGTWSSSKPLSGTRVQRVDVKLFPGEDFQLEVACLPKPEVLASHFAVVETMALQASAAATDASLLSKLMEICTDKAATVCKAPASHQFLTGTASTPIPDDKTLKGVADQLLRSIQTKWPVEEIAAVTSLRVCHAINKPLAARWKTNSKIETFRRSDEYSLGEILTPVKQNHAGAHGLLIDGKVELDLSLVESFQILAETTGADGLKLDDDSRGRSMISKRSGRWPTLIQQNGASAYVSPDDVLGFKVAEDGSVALPRRTITLLSVSNLPAHGAIGELVKPIQTSDKKWSMPTKAVLSTKVTASDPPGSPVFDGGEGRLTSIDLAPLFASASGQQILQRMALPEDALDVVKETRTLKSERSHKFFDTMARRLKLSIVSVSRHAPAFETAPTYGGSTQQLLFRRQPLKQIDQSIRSIETVEVWMRSTDRPAAPLVRRPEPSFLFSRASKPSPQGLLTHRVKRTAMTRLYFGRGWFDSGEGERLGIVLWPPRYENLTGANIDRDRIELDGRTMDLTDFQDRDLGAGGQYITRWGGDPIRRDASPQSGYLIPPTAFGEFKRIGQGPHSPLFEPTVKMPIPKAATPKNPAEPEGEAKAEQDTDDPKGYEYLSVSLLTFEPYFDIDREEWYIDVDLRPIRASEPFVRFGLVRYQKESISKELQVSEPVTVMVQLLPERDVSIAEMTSAKPDKRSFEISVVGLGQTDIKELDPGQFDDDAGRQAQWVTDFDTLRTPKVNVWLFHEAGRSGNLRRTPVVVDRPETDERALQTDENGWAKLPEAERENSNLVWKATFHTPHDLHKLFGPGRLVAYLEEIDRRMPASYRTEPIDLATMFSPSTFVDSGPRFSARVPFVEIEGPDPAN